MTYAITGASGQLGQLVAAALLERVDATETVLLSRTPETLSGFAGADRRLADFDRPETLPAALAGVDHLLVISTDRVGDRLAGQQAAVAAAAEAGVRRVLYTSVPEPVADNPAFVVPDHAATEQAIRDSGLEWTILRNNLYADMQVAAIDQAIAGGTLVTNTSDAGTAYVSRADCAAAAAAALVDEGLAGQVLDITGPEALTGDGLAELASRRAGTAVARIDVADEDYVAGMVQAGLPEGLAQGLASFGVAARKGYLDAVSTAVADLAGRQPTSLAALLGLS